MTTRADLLTLILDDIDRPDLNDTNPATVASWISRAEQRIQLELRVRKMLMSVTQAVGAALPADFIAVRSVSVASSTGTRKATLEYIPQEDMDEALSDPNALTGTPQFYTIDRVFRVSPAFSPTTTDTLALTYYAKLPALVNGTDTSWLLNDKFDLYFNAALIYAYGFLKEQGRAAEKEQSVSTDIIVMNAVDQQGETMKTRLVSRSRNPIGRR